MITIQEAINKGKETFASIKRGDVTSDISARTAAAYLTTLKSLQSKLDTMPTKELSDVSYDDIEDLLSDTTPGQKKNIRKALNKMFEEYGLNIPAEPVSIEGEALGNATLDEVVQAYEKYLTNIITKKGNGITESTARAFLYQLRKLKNDFAPYKQIKGLSLDKVPAAEIERYLAEHASSPSLHNQNVAMFRNMKKVVGDYIPLFEALPKKDKPKETVNDGQYLPPRELDALLCKPALNDKDARAQAMISIIISTLANIDDLQAITFADIGEKGLVLQCGCGHMVISPAYCKHITDWVYWAKKEFRIKDTTPLFFNPMNTSKALSRQSIWKIITSAVEESGYHKPGNTIAIQVLRVSAARKLYTEGYDMDMLAKLAGVKDIFSFIHVTPELLKKRNKALMKN